MIPRLSLVCVSMALVLSPAVAGPPGAARDHPKGTVAIEVRFISVAEDFFERIGVDFNRGGVKMEVVQQGETLAAVEKEGSAVFLDEKQVRKLLEDVQGDVRTNVMHAPRMVVTDGKTGEISCTDKRPFVTGMNAVREGGQIAVCPKTEELSTGYELSVRPTIAANKVVLDLRASLTSLPDDKVPLFPVFVPVMPVDKDGKPEKPVVFTQQIQQPRLTTLSLREEVTIPDGATVLFGGWKRVTEGRNEYGPPVLSKIPYLNRQFKNVGYGKSTEHILMMVRATVLHNENESVQATPKKHARHRRAAHSESDGIAPCAFHKPAADPCEMEQVKKAAKLVEKYHHACAAGRLDEARQYARHALELDPTCFDGEAGK